MPFLHKQCKTDHLNSRKTINIKPRTGCINVLSKNGLLYEGHWENDYRDGFGVFTKKFIKCKTFEPKYRGNWHEGKRHGLGNAYYGDGSYYVGEWKRNMRYGYGKMWYSDGSFYAGYWKCNKRWGRGLYVEVNGNRYEGEWWKDMMHGLGRYFHLMTGQMQEGAWVNNIAQCSTMEDIPFRQTVVLPTSYPIPELEVINSIEIVSYIQKKLLSNFETNEIQSISTSSMSLSTNIDSFQYISKLLKSILK